MARGEFLLLSLALHAALAGGAWLGTCAVAGSAARRRDDGLTIPLVIEGAPVNPLPQPRVPAPSSAASRPQPGAIRHVAATTPSPEARRALHERGKASATQEHVDHEHATSSEFAHEGAPASLFGTIPLRALLVSLSARADLFVDNTVRASTAYEARGDGATEPIVAFRSSHRDQANEAVETLLRRLLTHALARSPGRLAGTISWVVTRDESDDARFAITCDERTGHGMVRFTNGQRLEVDAR